jgi:hypothetical protein
VATYTTRSEVAAFLVGALVLASLASLGARPASAASSTCGSGSKFVGVQLAVGQASSGDGVQSNMEARFPFLCSSISGERWSLGTVMISPCCQDAWAQIGWIRNTTLCCHRFFWQWKKDNLTAKTAYWGNPTVHTRYNFKVTRLASDGHLHMLYLNPDQTPPSNQAGWDPETNFDPYVEWDTRHMTVFAEVGHPGSDVAGTESAKASNVEILVRPRGGAWEDPSTWSTFNDRPCYYHRATINAYKSFNTWTDPLNHGTTC